MKPRHIVQMAIIGVLIVAIVIGNAIVLEPQMEQNISGQQSLFEEILNFHPFPADKNTISAARAEGQALSKQIVEEGSVLVKNNGVLPLDKNEDDRVNVAPASERLSAEAALITSDLSRFAAERPKAKSQSLASTETASMTITVIL